MQSHAVKYIKEVLKDEFTILDEPNFKVGRFVNFRQSKWYDSLKDTFEELGGKIDPFYIESRPIDLEINGVAIIVDTDIDYNRYRSITLGHAVYDELKEFKKADHLRFCRQHERECVSAGSNSENWSSTEADLLFGPSDESGELGKSGASLWKYRAMSNLQTDLSSVMFHYPLLRISIYDNLMVGGNIITLKSLLLTRKEEARGTLMKTLKRRIETLNPPLFS